MLFAVRIACILIVTNADSCGVGEILQAKLLRISEHIVIAIVIAVQGICAFVVADTARQRIYDIT